MVLSSAASPNRHVNPVELDICQSPGYTPTCGFAAHAAAQPLHHEMVHVHEDV